MSPGSRSSSSAISSTSGGRPQPLFELVEHPVDASQLADAIQWQPHDARLIRQCLQNRLADPPHGIRNEFEAFGAVKALGGDNKPQVPLVDQVRKRQAQILILLRHTYDKAQVSFDQIG